MQKLNDRKRSLQTQSFMNTSPKKARMATNSSVKPAMTLEQLQQMGITKLASDWGLMDKDTIPEDVLPVKAVRPSPRGEISHGAASQSVTHLPVKPLTASEKQEKFANLLKRPSAGSMNFVKYVTEKSLGKTAIAPSVRQRGQCLENSQPTAARELTFDVLRQRHNQARYVDLGVPPAPAIDKAASGEAHRAYLNKLRFEALAKKEGGYAAMRDTDKQQRLMSAGKVKLLLARPVVAGAKTPVISAELLAMLRQGSANKRLVDEQKSFDLEEKLDRLEKVEQMETKLSEQHEQDCVLFLCTQVRLSHLSLKMRIFPV